MKRNFPGQNLCSGAFGGNIRPYTKQRARHRSPFLERPPPSFAGRPCHPPPPPPAKQFSGRPGFTRTGEHRLAQAAFCTLGTHIHCASCASLSSPRFIGGLQGCQVQRNDRSSQRTQPGHCFRLAHVSEGTTSAHVGKETTSAFQIFHEVADEAQTRISRNCTESIAIVGPMQSKFTWVGDNWLAPTGVTDVKFPKPPNPLLASRAEDP